MFLTFGSLCKNIFYQSVALDTILSEELAHVQVTMIHCRKVGEGCGGFAWVMKPICQYRLETADDSDKAWHGTSGVNVIKLFSFITDAAEN